jgi:prevent-host-death family protein
MSKTVTIHEAKTNLSRLIKQVCEGEEIIIARGKSPVARLVPVSAPPKKRRVPGALKGIIKVDDSFFDPLPPEELDAWDQ